MQSESHIKHSGISIWLMSLIILLSMLGFSASAPAPSAQKKVETENIVFRKRTSKQHASFNQLKSVLTIRIFFDELVVLSTAHSEHQLKKVLQTVFDSACLTFDSLLKPNELSQFIYRARNADDLRISYQG